MASGSPASPYEPVAAAPLFPAGVLAGKRPVTAAALDALYQEELALVANAVESRRREFATGRLLARELLRELGFADAPLLHDRRRAPQWPPGAVGSIAHTDGCCAAAVARDTDVAAVGIDLEATLELDESLWGQTLTAGERGALARLPGPTARRVAMQAFCAKEALYKAQYPLTKSWLGFEEVSIAFPGDGSFDIEIAAPPIGSALAPFTLTGAIEVGDLVTAAVTARRR